MSDAYFSHGLAIEVDVSVPRITIDGREIPAEGLSNLVAPSDSATAKAEKLRRYAERHIKDLPEFEIRDVTVTYHSRILKKGKEEWDRWRSDNPEIRPLLYDTILTKDVLPLGLDGWNFANANLICADLRGQSLVSANFHEANLAQAKLHDANLTGANFCRTDLYETEMPRAILHNANLQGTQLAKTNLEEAELIGCKIYGMSAWDLRLDGAKQTDLRILYRHKNLQEDDQEALEAEILVDDLHVAQFIYFILNNDNITTAIDTIGERGVLILGRFGNRKHVLDKIREALRSSDHGFVPIIFDFKKPNQRDFTETIRILAGLSRFIIADITSPRSSPLELAVIVPDYMIPLVPILEVS